MYYFGSIRYGLLCSLQTEEKLIGEMNHDHLQIFIYVHKITTKNIYILHNR